MKTESINITNNNSQQPKVIACQGGGEHTGVTQGYSENGTSDEYPPVDTSSSVQKKKGCGKVICADDAYDGKMVICGEYGDILCDACAVQEASK